MSNRLVKRGSTTYIPGVQTVPAQPAYCVVSTVPVTVQAKKPGVRVAGDSSERSAFSSGGHLTSGSIGGVPVGQHGGYYGIPAVQTGTTDPATGLPTVVVSGVVVPAPSTNTSQAQAAGSFTTYYEGGTVCYPAIPGVQGYPSQVVTEDILGWNGGARSIDAFSADGFVQFRLAPRPTGVVAGLATADASGAFNEATHAIYAHGAVVAVVESGTVVATSAYSPADDPLVTIVRRSGRVTYYVDDWSYTSLVPSVGTVFLDAALYSTGDIVDTPAIGPLSELPAGLTEHGSGSPTMPAVMGQGSENAYAQGSPELPAITATGTGVQTGLNTGSPSLPAVSGYGADRPYAAGAVDLPVITAIGDGGFPVFATAVGSAVLPPLLSVGVMMTGTIGSGSPTLPALSGYGADRDYAAGVATLPAMLGYGDDGPAPGTYGVMEFAYFIDFLVTDPVFFGLVWETVELTDSATFVLIVDNSVFDSLVIDNTFTLSALIAAAINDRLIVNSSTSAARTAALQYAVNLSTGALTTYQGFDFVGFANTATAAFGWKADGVYRIGGDSDDGALRNALVAFGADSYDTNLKKHVPAAFLGLGTDGCAYLRMSGDGDCENVYRVIQRGDTCRANPHRGLSAREWNVTLEIVDASDAVLDNIEYAIEVTTRRWTR